MSFRAISALVLALLFATPLSLAAASSPSVLILLPGQPGLPFATAIATGIREALLAGWSLQVNIEMQHVDIGRSGTRAEERRLRTLYGDKHFDLIIAAGGEALQFVLRARDELWRGIPVVVSAVDERTVVDMVVPAGFTIVTTRFDMEGTLRAALALRPDTHRVALVGGAGPQEQAFHTLARKAIAALGLDVIDLTPLPIGEVMARVATLPEHTIIFAVTYQMDGAGHRFHGLDIVGPLAATANAPLFTATNVAALGRGIVGGSLIDFEAVGREAGTIANRVLRGEATPRSPVASAATNRLFFDGRQLARWQLDERRLPNDREVIFSQRTLWGQYRWHILGAAGIIAGQAALIVALLVQRRRRREAVTALRQVEAVAQRQLRQIIQLDRVAAMGTLASSIAHELNQPLAGILANAQAANRRLADSQPDLDEVRACLADIVDDDRRAADVIRGMRRLLRKADVVAAPISLNDLAANTIRLVTNDARLQEVTIDFEPAPGLPLTSGDPVQIQQVILNLLTNAIAAAANGGAPRNTVRVWTTTATPPFIELGVNDSGKGILEPDLQRIFEPFFTTKPDGLGIGLTISRTIVEAHGGRLVVENDPRGGATFRVNLRTDESPTS